MIISSSISLISRRDNNHLPGLSWSPNTDWLWTPLRQQPPTWPIMVSQHRLAMDSSTTTTTYLAYHGLPTQTGYGLLYDNNHLPGLSWSPNTDWLWTPLRQQPPTWPIMVSQHRLAMDSSTTTTTYLAYHGLPTQTGYGLLYDNNHLPGLSWSPNTNWLWTPLRQQPPTWPIMVSQHKLAMDSSTTTTIYLAYHGLPTQTGYGLLYDNNHLPGLSWSPNTDWLWTPLRQQPPTWPIMVSQHRLAMDSSTTTTSLHVVLASPELSVVAKTRRNNISFVVWS